MLRRITRGFTLIEIIVVVAVVSLLSTAILVALGGAREKSRDTQRLSDLSQVQIAIRLYQDANDAYIVSPEGQMLGVGGTIDTDLAPYLPIIPVDPQVHDSDYYYRYDSGVNCTGTGQRVLFAKIVETDVMKNYSATCTCTSSCGFDEGIPVEGHVILLR